MIDSGVLASVASAATAIGEVFCGCACGYAVAKAGYLPAETRLNLSKIALRVFLPCLMFEQLVKGIDIDNPWDCAFVPLNVAIAALPNLIIAHYLAKWAGLGDIGRA